MDEYQRILNRAIKEQLRPSRLLARFLIHKLRGQGIKQAETHIDDIEKALDAALSQADGSNSLQLRTGVPAIDSLTINVELEDAELQKFLKDVQNSLEVLIPELHESIVAKVLTNVKREAAEGLRLRRLDRERFESNLYARWRKPLDLLAVHIEIARESGEKANSWLRKRRLKKNPHTVEALTRLHARACQVAGEILTLLLSGYADGALARWRTLHEIAVVGWFLEARGDDVAERYLLHTAIDSLRSATQFNQFAALLAYKSVSEPELARLSRAVDGLTSRFGAEFREEYGWAAAALNSKRPSFADIEKAAKFEKMRPYFRFASQNVHAASKAVYVRLGNIDDAPILLAGPSNAGLEEAGRLCAISIHQITHALLSIASTIDAAIYSRILESLSQEIEQSFLREEAKLKREERRRRRGRPT